MDALEKGTSANGEWGGGTIRREEKERRSKRISLVFPTVPGQNSSRGGNGWELKKERTSEGVPVSIHLRGDLQNKENKSTRQRNKGVRWD